MLDRREILRLGAAAGAIVVAATARAQMAPAPSAPNDGEALADRLVAAMGGRENWVRAKGLGIAGVHLLADFPEPLANQLYVAFEQPLMRFDARGEGFQQVRVIAGDKGSYSTGGAVPRPMTPAAVKGDLDWWESHFYRNVRRLAVRDPAISLRAHKDGRLELVRADGKRVVWYRLNQQGEPIAYGSFEQEEGNVFGPLHEVAGGLRLPTFAVSHDGTFRALDLKPTVYASIPSVDFERP